MNFVRVAKPRLAYKPICGAADCCRAATSGPRQALYPAARRNFPPYRRYFRLFDACTLRELRGAGGGQSPPRPDDIIAACGQLRRLRLLRRRRPLLPPPTRQQRPRRPFLCRSFRRHGITPLSTAACPSWRRAPFPARSVFFLHAIHSAADAVSVARLALNPRHRTGSRMLSRTALRLLKCHPRSCPGTCPFVAAVFSPP